VNLDSAQFSTTFLVIIAGISASFTAIWLSLTVWAFRDMRLRSRDIVSQMLAALVVLILNVPGFIVYLILRPRETLAEQYERALEEEALLQGIEEKQTCPGCNHPTRETWRLCPYCHTKLRRPCASCQELLDLHWPICPRCETPQPEYSSATRATGAPLPDVGSES
jgi:double zinc ribbon protein